MPPRRKPTVKSTDEIPPASVAVPVTATATAAPAAAAAAAPAPAPAAAAAPVPAAAPEPASTLENMVAAPQAETTKPVKKKGKKAVTVVALVTPDGIEGNFQPVEQRRSLISHLNIKSNEVSFNGLGLQYDPTPPKQPEPYDGEGDDLYANFTRATFETDLLNSMGETSEDIGKPIPIADPLGNPQHFSKQQDSEDGTQEEVKSLHPFYRCNLMVCYRTSNESKKLPEKVDIACFWCTEDFPSQPVVIPEREEKGIYRVYGNFCCPECALSYLLQENIDPHVRWERMSLLHRLYMEYYTGRIFPAPSRQSLKKFGGPMNIEQFRNTIYGQSVRIDIQMPPLVSILGTMDTKPIDFYDNSVRTSSSGIMNERISKAEAGLRLKRTKPLKDKESTLDACMKISIKTKGDGKGRGEAEGQI